ncbi:efflux RND transporter periplasmic adaptor subunit [Adhaeretor mobilis]|uniref:Putative efflux pump membrane fusion protein n=1 Tax=Adhaeretor mobilis TaxID=1930276 RepID=A0A517MWG4_9BACT|nr:efflux RND transporter periplasmic adaptor subunit [Adhaeretor mobilis]QDS99147.1 putative efflux pump membrane fusion protein [Adhaeretor mobilis]
MLAISEFFQRPPMLKPALLCLATLNVAISGKVRAQPERPPAPVVVARVAQRNVTAAQGFVGTVMPSRHAIIGSAVDGRVVEFPVEEGDRVEPKQKLAQLLTETIKLELASAEAELQLRQQQLLELENGTRPEEIEQARSRMAAADARQRFQQARVERLETAAETRGAVTEDVLAEARAVLIERQELYLDMKAAHALAVAGPRPEVIYQGKAQVAFQQAVVEKLSDQIKKHTIISRFAGYVVKEHTEAGQWVNRGDPVAEVAALDEVDVVVQVVEQSVPFIRLGTDVRVEIPALPDRVFIGKVEAVVPQADERSRTFPVKIRVINEVTSSGPLVQAGMVARAALPVGKPQQALLVPKDAIVLGGPRPMVFTVADATKEGDLGKVQSVVIELGVAHGDWIQIFGAIEPDAFVVVQGNERLIPQSQVRLLNIIADLPTQ